MTNKEWKDLVAKEFGVSNNIASKMVHAMFSVYNIEKAVQERLAKDSKPWTELVTELATKNN